MKTPIINNLFELMLFIFDYEPSLIKYIMDFVFIPCSEDKEGKYDYIRALPVEGTTSIYNWEDIYSWGLVRNWFNSAKMIIIDKSVTEIGKYAFLECIGLESIIIPNSVTRIRRSAFEECVNLKSIDINTIEEFKLAEVIQKKFKYNI